MSEDIARDFSDMERKLRFYVDNGTAAGSSEAREDPEVSVKPDQSKVKPLNSVSSFSGAFVAVDCSTRTLKRANNWGVYLMRSAYASVRGRDVDWGFKERICTVVGDSYGRSNLLKDVRIELESQMALGLLENKAGSLYYDHTDSRSNYLLLDGGGYFGGDRKFRVSLYDRCEKEGIRLLAVSKNSPSLHDEKGRDFLAAVRELSSHDVWVYHPVRKADKDKSLYGDITVTKLCKESAHVFRCDVMAYLTDAEVTEIISPLTYVCGDPRCVGYPVPLWLAHEFSGPSDSALIFYYDQVEEALKQAGLFGALHREELSCSFADELHGVRYPFKMEMVGDYV